MPTLEPRREWRRCVKCSRPLAYVGYDLCVSCQYKQEAQEIVDPRCKICREPITSGAYAALGFCSDLCRSTWKLREERKAKQLTTLDDQTAWKHNRSYADELEGKITLSIQQFSFSNILRMRTPAGFTKAPICQMKQHDLIAAGLWDLLK